jgi:hypothetical protein
MSDTSRIQLAFVAESTYAAQKTGVNLQILRLTGESLKQDTGSTESGEIRSDRQLADIRRTRIGASGAVNFELSYGTYDTLMAAALLDSAWSSAVAVSGTTISFSSVDNSINDSGSGFGSITDYSWIKVWGAATAANNGFFKVTSAAAGKLVVAGGTLVTEGAARPITVYQGAEIVNGTTLPSYNLERTYADLATTLSLFKGMCANGLSLDIPAEGMITGTFDFVGSVEDSITVSGGTGYTAATTTKPITDTEVVTFFENMTSQAITAFSMALTNNLRQRMRVGSAGVVSVGTGNVGITGTLRMLFETVTMFDKYLDETATSLAMLITDQDANSYVIDLPAIKFTNGQRVAGGPNDDVLADMSWSAYMHATEGKTIRIARFPANASSSASTSVSSSPSSSPSSSVSSSPSTSPSSSPSA